MTTITKNESTTRIEGADMLDPAMAKTIWPHLRDAATLIRIRNPKIRGLRVQVIANDQAHIVVDWTDRADGCTAQSLVSRVPVSALVHVLRALEFVQADGVL